MTALPTPGSAVRVNIGACGSPNDFIPGRAQAYLGEEDSSTDVEIPATGSSGSAVRYLCWRVYDEQYAGNPPANPATDPRAAYVLLSQDPRVTKPAYPWVLLAKISQPASTATITQAMIEDVRTVAVPRREEKLYAYAMTMAAGTTYLADKKTGGEFFPGGEAGQQYNNVGVDIPEWATQMFIEADWYGVKYLGVNTYGQYWIEYGDEYRAGGWTNQRDYEFECQHFSWDVSEAGKIYRTQWGLGDMVTIPSKLRGKRCRFLFKASVANAPTAGVNKVLMDSLSGIKLRVTFKDIATLWGAGLAS